MKKGEISTGFAQFHSMFKKSSAFNQVSATRGGSFASKAV
jgi:hypothetical protein